MLRAMWTGGNRLSGLGAGFRRGHDSATAECLKNDRAADAEAENCTKGGNLKNGIPDVEIISDQRGGSKGDSEDVEPEWGPDIWKVAAKTCLQEQGGETDCGDHDQSKRTEESATAGEDDDEREGEDEKARGNDGPTTSDLARAGIGQWAISPRACITLL